MINKPAIKQWVEALRSGEYPQTTDRLHNEEGYCCLGVACHLSGLGTWKLDEHSTEPAVWGYVIGDGLREVSVLPDAVIEHYGLISPNPILFESELEEEERTLASLNDAGYPFIYIAELIEREYLGK